jgi:predicted HicB family RNase H-like nuclease
MEENFASPKRKAENRSFRIDSGTLTGLEDEAARKKVSVNTLVIDIGIISFPH